MMNAHSYELPEGFADHIADELAPAKKPLDVLLREADPDGKIAKRRREKEEEARRLAQSQKSQEDAIAKKQERIRQLVEILASVFMSGNLGSDQKLDFNEFKASIPDHVRAGHDEEEMREVFDMADADGGGTLSREEYFFWTLRWMASSGGVSGLQKNFSRFDASGDGELSRREWAMAADRFGFGEMGQEVFTELDDDKTGTISYKELIDTLLNEPGHMSLNCQRLLTAMAFYTGDPTEEGGPESRIAARNFDTTIWHAQSVDDVRATIRDRMLQQLATPNDVWQSLLKVAGRGRRLSKDNFIAATYKVLGYECTTAWERDVCEAVYDEMDDDKSGDITFDEFLNWINCRQQRRRLARKLNLKWRPKRAKPLRQIVWTPEVIRRELQAMLTRGEVSTLDLLMAHDQTENGKLDEHEFLAMMKSIISDSHCWFENGARKACVELFYDIAGDDNEIDLEELEGWFIQGMAVEKPRAQKKKEQDAKQKALVQKLDEEKRRQPMKSTSMPNIGAKGRARAPPPPPDLVEEKSSEGKMAGSGLATRWLLRNSSVDDVLHVRRADRLRFVPGAKQFVARQPSPANLPPVTRIGARFLSPGLVGPPSTSSLKQHHDVFIQHPSMFNPKHRIYKVPKAASRPTRPPPEDLSVEMLIKEYSKRDRLSTPSNPYKGASRLRFY